MISIQSHRFLSTMPSLSGQARGASQGLKTSRSSKFLFQIDTAHLDIHVRTTSRENLGDQNALVHFHQSTGQEKTLSVYNHTPVSSLSPQEAQSLISEEGYFGIKKTSQRIYDFVIKLAGNDPERLKAGREGVLKGFAQAEKAWGEALPEICYKTLDKTLEAIDCKIGELGGSVLNLTA